MAHNNKKGSRRMRFNEMCWIQHHAQRTFRDANDLIIMLRLKKMYKPRNPFNFRTEHDFYVTWRNEWDRLYAAAIAKQNPTDNTLADIGVRAK